MSDDYRARALVRLEWVLSTHQLPTPVVDAITDAVDALGWDAVRDALTDAALSDALRNTSWSQAIAIVEALEPHSFDDVRRSDVIAALTAAAEKARP